MFMQNNLSIPNKGLQTKEAVTNRLEYLQAQNITTHFISKTSLTAQQIQNNIESNIGSVEIPIGLAGPLLFSQNIEAEIIHAPVATLEGALVASMNRGVKAVSQSGGFRAEVIHQKMIRSPMFIFRNIRECMEFKTWVELYRLLSFPIVLTLALLGYENIFVLLLCINLITDILDGLIARAFDMQTEIGAKLDSYADTGTYILAFLGIVLFKLEEFSPYVFSFSIFVGLYLLCDVVSLIKFGRLPSLHLYSWKIGGYIQGLFFFVLFVFGFYPAFYYFMVTWGILEFLEHLTIQFLIKKMQSNAKGLYWILKKRG